MKPILLLDCTPPLSPKQLNRKLPTTVLVKKNAGPQKKNQVAPQKKPWEPPAPVGQVLRFHLLHQSLRGGRQRCSAGLGVGQGGGGGPGLGGHGKNPREMPRFVDDFPTKTFIYWGFLGRVPDEISV